MKRFLFCCSMNSIRSPVAVAILQHKLRVKDNVKKDGILISSAGVEQGILDGFIASIMKERGTHLIDYEPKSIAYLAMQPWDLIVAFTSASYKVVKEIALRTGAKVVLWEVDDPSVFEGNREQKIDKYREVCNDIEKLINTNFKHL